MIAPVPVRQAWRVWLKLVGTWPRQNTTTQNVGTIIGVYFKWGQVINSFALSRSQYLHMGRWYWISINQIHRKLIKRFEIIEVKRNFVLKQMIFISNLNNLTYFSYRALEFHRGLHVKSYNYISVNFNHSAYFLYWVLEYSTSVLAQDGIYIYFILSQTITRIKRINFVQKSLCNVEILSKLYQTML